MINQLASRFEIQPHINWQTNAFLWDLKLTGALSAENCNFVDYLSSQQYLMIPRTGPEITEYLGSSSNVFATLSQIKD